MSERDRATGGIVKQPLSANYSEIQHGYVLNPLQWRRLQVLLRGDLAPVTPSDAGRADDG